MCNIPHQWTIEAEAGEVLRRSPRFVAPIAGGGLSGGGVAWGLGWGPFGLVKTCGNRGASSTMFVLKLKGQTRVRMKHFLVVIGASKDRGITFEGNERSPG